jgi:hypothetical protein
VRDDVHGCVTPAVSLQRDTRHSDKGPLRSRHPAVQPERVIRYKCALVHRRLCLQPCICKSAGPVWVFAVRGIKAARRVQVHNMPVACVGQGQACCVDGRLPHAELGACRKRVTVRWSKLGQQLQHTSPRDGLDDVMVLDLSYLCQRMQPPVETHHQCAFQMHRLDLFAIFCLACRMLQ